ncbi:hypothetical protein [Marisediminicola senii]|uniref:hypothetical protein n=1 Tax=Marisediminicola senii TaxID=2711233 RepID=UPI0013EC78F1|nr:hypothetical protein [Marisediminicola senii]
MQWWNDVTGWLASDAGTAVMTTAVIPFVAIVVAGIVAALIGRGSTKRLLARNDRENRVNAVATIVGAARRAAIWNTLSTEEQLHADHVAAEADVRLRLLNVAGSTRAADWAAHEIADMKSSSVSYSAAADHTLLELRDRMVSWQERPSRAKKLFKDDLDLWAHEKTQLPKDVVATPREWSPAGPAQVQQVPVQAGPVQSAPVQTVPAQPAPPQPAPPQEAQPQGVQPQDEAQQVELEKELEQPAASQSSTAAPVAFVEPTEPIVLKDPNAPLLVEPERDEDPAALERVLGDRRA